jgi:hypothetical protein
VVDVETGTTHFSPAPGKETTTAKNNVVATFDKQAAD